MANPTADWEKVGDKFYRKIQLYTAVFDQDLELDNYIVTGCSYGGAIGMLFHQLVVARGRGEASQWFQLVLECSEGEMEQHCTVAWNWSGGLFMTGN